MLHKYFYFLKFYDIYFIISNIIKICFKKGGRTKLLTSSLVKDDANACSKRRELSLSRVSAGDYDPPDRFAISHAMKILPCPHIRFILSGLRIF